MLRVALGVRDAVSVLRSLLFWVGVVITTIGFALVGVAVGWALPFERRYQLIVGWNRVVLAWLRIAVGLRYRVEGLEHLPAGPAVVLAKHQSAWETIALPVLMPMQTWLLKSDLLRIPFFGWGLRLLEPVPVDRQLGPRAIRQIIETGQARLQQGRWVVVYPEGRRLAPGARGRYYLGGAMLAVRAGRPVVPVAHNAGEYWPPRHFTKYPGTIQVRIGPAIQTEGKTPEAVTREAESWIEARMAEITGGGPAAGTAGRGGAAEAAQSESQP